MHVRRPDQDDHLMRRALVTSAVAVAALALAPGCRPYGHAEVVGLCPSSTRTTGAGSDRRVHRVSFDTSVATGKASMDLLYATLGLAGATGSPRLARSGLAHFGLEPDTSVRAAVRTGGIVIDIARDDGLGQERWVVDPRWLLRRLDGGGLLARQGDFRDVLSALALIMPELEDGAAMRAR